jgi:hypothetical protein
LATEAKAVDDAVSDRIPLLGRDNAAAASPRLTSHEPGHLKAHLLSFAPFAVSNSFLLSARTTSAAKAARGLGGGASPFDSLPTSGFAAIVSPVEPRAVADRTALPNETFPRQHAFYGALIDAKGGCAKDARLNQITNDLAAAATRSPASPAATLGEQLRRCFEVAGKCILSRAVAGPGDAITTELIKAVVAELRRDRSAPAPAWAVSPSNAVTELDLSDLPATALPRVAIPAEHVKAAADITASAPDPARGNAKLHLLLRDIVDHVVSPGDAANRLHRISRLRWNNGEVYDSDCVVLGRILRSPVCTLTQVFLRGNRISPNGADHLKKALKHNTLIRVLDLAANEWLSLPGFEPSGDDILSVIGQRLANNVNGVPNQSGVRRMMQC